MYIYIYIYVYTYMYIWRERDWQREVNMPMHTCHLSGVCMDKSVLESCGNFVIIACPFHQGFISQLFLFLRRAWWFVFAILQMWFLLGAFIHAQMHVICVRCGCLGGSSPRPISELDVCHWSDILRLCACVWHCACMRVCSMWGGVTRMCISLLYPHFLFQTQT